jgi:hypothetical protein
MNFPGTAAMGRHIRFIQIRDIIGRAVPALFKDPNRKIFLTNALKGKRDPIPHPDF